MKDYSKQYDNTGKYEECRVNYKAFQTTTNQISEVIPDATDFKNGTPEYTAVNDLNKITQQIATNAKSTPTEQVDAQTLEKYDVQLQKTLQTIAKNKEALTNIDVSGLQKALNALAAVFGIKNAFDGVFKTITQAQKQFGITVDEYTNKVGNVTNLTGKVKSLETQFGKFGKDVSNLGKEVGKDVGNAYKDTKKATKEIFKSKK